MAPSALTSSPVQDIFPIKGSPEHSSSPHRHYFAAPRRQHTQTSLDTNYRGPVIPPRVDRRTLVLCFDGTGDQFDGDNSNIVQFFSMLKKGDVNRQMVYYQAGIGTYTIPQIATPFYSSFSKTVDMMFASNLNHHVMGGYEFLMQNYKEGDKICIFGFSRGAYTVRALAGMIHKIGLLPACNHQQVPFAYRMYMDDDETGWKQSVLFKKTFSVDVDIDFVGVWDTVASVGLFPRHLPFTKSNTAIKTFRHALSLDERRAKFKANQYQRSTDKEVELDGRSKKRNADSKKRSATFLGNYLSFPGKTDDGIADNNKKREMLENQYTDTSCETDALEVWFAGCHCDVGGGSVLNGTRHSLARIPLRWMIRQCFLTCTGIQFEADLLHEVGLDPDSLYPIVRPRPPPLPISQRDAMIRSRSTNETLVNGGGEDESDVEDDESDGEWMSEEQEELNDALSPIYDQLESNWGWWILEVLPTRERMREEDGTWTKKIALNMGGPRVVPNQRKNGINVHRSVKIRMEAGDKNYTPRVKFDVEPTWVD